MRILLDTHAFLWWIAGDLRLSNTARRAIAAADTDVVVSAASAREIATKHRLGTLPEASALATDIRACISGQDFQELSVTVADADRAGRLTGPVRISFDRILIAQALPHDFDLVSKEEVLDWYSATRLW